MLTKLAVGNGEQSAISVAQDAACVLCVPLFRNLETLCSCVLTDQPICSEWKKWHVRRQIVDRRIHASFLKMYVSISSLLRERVVTTFNQCER